MEELEAQHDDSTEESVSSNGESTTVTAEKDTGRKTQTGSGDTFALIHDDLTTLLQHEAIQTAIDAAMERGKSADKHYNSVLSVLASAGDQEYRLASEVATPLDVSESTVLGVVQSLHTTSVVTREKQTRGHKYALDRELLEERIEVAKRQAAIATESSASSHS